MMKDDYTPHILYRNTPPPLPGLKSTFVVFCFSNGAYSSKNCVHMGRYNSVFIVNCYFPSLSQTIAGTSYFHIII